MSSSVYGAPLRGRCIRLLQILPDCDDSNVQLKMFEASLDDNVEYTALSYAWSERRGIAIIRCNGQQLLITQSLLSALRQFRSEKNSMLFWIDAVCINQTDDVEKTYQVKLMREIYTQAHVVLVWLGEAERSDILGFATMNQLFAALGSCMSPDYARIDALSLKELGLPEVDNDAWHALWLLCTRPWFRRVWTIQEFLASSIHIFRFGSVAVAGDVLLTVAEIFHRCNLLPSSDMMAMHENDEDTHDAMQNAVTLRAMKDQYDAGGCFDFLTLLQLTQKYRSSDARDRMFALVSLCTDVPASFIDYSLSYHEVATRTARYAMHSMQRQRHRSPVDILSYASGLSADHRLPSWVPRWYANSYTTTPLTDLWPSFRAGLLNDSNLHSADHSLVLFGAQLDTVGSTVPLAERDADYESWLLDRSQRWMAYDKQCFNHVCQLVELEKYPTWLSYPTGERLSEAFYRTRSLGQWHLEHEIYELDKSTVATLLGLIASPFFGPYVFGLMIPIAYHYGYGRRLTLSGQILIVLVFTIMVFVIQAVAPDSVKYVGDRISVLLRRGVNPSQMRFARSIDQLFDLRNGRKFAVTEKGYFGWVSTETQAGDQVYQFDGCKVPFVLRPSADNYHLVGDSYFYAISDLCSVHYEADWKKITLI